MKSKQCEIVKAWNNGDRHASGAGYGIRISPSGRNRIFSTDQESIKLRLEGCESSEITVSLSPSFWRKCSELRNQAIGQCLIKRGLQDWEHGKPPFLVLEMHDSHYLLRRFANGKRYTPLNEFLLIQAANHVESFRLTFEQIAVLIASPLPEAALKWPAWWGFADVTHPQSHAWTSAGYFAHAEFEAGRVHFTLKAHRN